MKKQMIVAIFTVVLAEIFIVSLGGTTDKMSLGSSHPVISIIVFFVGLVLGIVLSIIIIATLWSLKSNLDDWANSHPDFLANEPEAENKEVR